MFEAAVSGLITALSWPSIGYMVFGVLLGLYFGAVPGLSGVTGMAILLPFTFGMDPTVAFAFLLGMYAVTTTADSLPAILIGVPGTAAAQATVLEGYPMAQRGEANRALSVAFTCAAIGGVMGALIMGLSIPIVRPLVLAFAKPESFMLCVLALTMVASLSGASIVKGLIGASLGLLLSMVGYAEQHAEPRFWMGIPDLLTGIPMVALILGLFAFPEVATLAMQGKPIADTPQGEARGGLATAWRDIVQHRWLMIRSAFLGVYVGILPGLGGAIADWVGYGHAVQSAKDKSQFRKGDVRGLIAPETASNSVKGGELIPTVAFGIPGSSAMAILLGAFLIQGLTPGPQMLGPQLPLTYSLVWTLVFANVLGAALLLLWSRQLQRIIFLPGRLVLPAIMIFLLMGAWTSGASISDWVMLLVFGVVGIMLKWAGWAPATVVLGFVLGGIMENALHLSMRTYGLGWITRPYVIALALAIAVALFFAVRALVADRRQKTGGQNLAEVAHAHTAAEGDARVSLLLSGLFLVLFCVAIVQAQAWPLAMSQFPLAIAVPAAILAVVATVFDWRAVRSLIRSAGLDPGLLPRVAGMGRFLLWVVGIIGATILFGQLVALPVFAFLYLLVEARTRLWLAALYALLVATFLYVTFEKVVGVVWYPSMFLRM